tara:strand:- start:549 stop:1460 length:912 start_codon:yes stop_codon:yes gene_type:complete
MVPFWAAVIMVVPTAFFSAAFAMMGHEGSHRSFSSSPFRNQLLFHLAFPLFGGVSGQYWSWKHDANHHSNPNVVDQDPDIQLWPMVSTATEYRRSSGWRQFFQRRLQGFAFWPLCLMLVWSMRTSSLAFMYRSIRDRGFDRDVVWDTVSLTLHIALWIVVPIYFFGFNGLLLYVGVWSLVGLFLSMVFSPAHIGMPIYQDTKDTIRLQFETTRNLVLPAWLSFFFIGLEYQIEHHLFPRIPHQNLKAASKITRAWAQENGAPYHAIGYGQGLVAVTKEMNNAWKREPALLANDALNRSLGTSG